VAKKDFWEKAQYLRVLLFIMLVNDPRLQTLVKNNRVMFFLNTHINHFDEQREKYGEVNIPFWYLFSVFFNFFQEAPPPAGLLYITKSNLNDSDPFDC